jgi:hypothetical protein
LTGRFFVAAFFAVTFFFAGAFFFAGVFFFTGTFRFAVPFLTAIVNSFVIIGYPIKTNPVVAQVPKTGPRHYL